MGQISLSLILALSITVAPSFCSIRVERQAEISKFKDVTCNPDHWDDTMGRLLRGEAEVIMNPNDSKKQEYVREQLNSINVWRTRMESQLRLGIGTACNLERSLRCNQYRKCVCGDIAPFIYEESNGKCKLTSGSYCKNNEECIGNNCNDNFCGKNASSTISPYYLAVICLFGVVKLFN